jgi:orotate phosphoribosyltransferase
LPTIFCERVNGQFELRRGFELDSDMRVLVVEDVITTGKSSLETYDLIKKFGAKIVAEASLVDRSGYFDGGTLTAADFIATSTLTISTTTAAAISPA